MTKIHRNNQHQLSNKIDVKNIISQSYLQASYTNDPNFYLKSLIEKIFDLKRNNLFINGKLYKNFIPLIENFKEKEEEKYNVLMNYLYLKKYKYKSFKEIFSNGVPEYEDLLLLYNNKKENVEFLKKLMVSRELTR